MFKIILQNFQENNNIINVAVSKKFIKSKNHIYHVLSIQKRFLITYESYTHDFEIMMTDNCELFTIFYSHLSLIEEVSSVHHADIFTAQD